MERIRWRPETRTAVMRTCVSSIVIGVLGLIFVALPLAAQETAKIDIEANIDSLPDNGLVGEWSIGGKKVNVTKKTFLKETRGDKFKVGQRVEVTGYMTGDELDADRIETRD